MADSVAEMLLAAAREDAKALHALLSIPEISDAIIGFHAQQAVEKSLKAVLSANGIAFRRTHDIAELLDIMADQHLPAPPFAETLDELNPFAVEARYGLVNPGQLDRSRTARLINAVLAWATEQPART